MKACLACGKVQCDELIDFGLQPICHHFVDTTHSEKFYPLSLGQCGGCGTVQSMVPVPPGELVPHFDWITYNEPESHLDALVDLLCSLPGVTRQSNIISLSYKEDSTLRRFKDRGFEKTTRLDPQKDLAIGDSRAGVEMIQGAIDADRATQIQQKYGTADLIIARHILEHTQSTSVFLDGLRKMVRPSGYVVFEVPDCKRAFDLKNYTTLWEDHTLYLLEETFCALLEQRGFRVAQFVTFRAPYEDCLVAVATPAVVSTDRSTEPEFLRREIARAKEFAAGLLPRKRELHQALREWRVRGKIALLGAGHLSATYLNVFELGGVIDFVIDDHPEKRIRRMPGSRLSIVGSEILADPGIALCLMGVSAETEKKIVQKQQSFIERGGTLASIFPIDAGALFNVIAGPANP